MIYNDGSTSLYWMELPLAVQILRKEAKHGKRFNYIRALLAKEIDVAADCKKQKSQVVYQQYCAGGTMHRGYYCPSLTEDLWLGNTKFLEFEHKSGNAFAAREKEVVFIFTALMHRKKPLERLR